MTNAIKLFGPKWDGTPVGDACERVPVPVGARCFRCDGEILEGQSGAYIWHITQSDVPAFEPWHRLCVLINVLGTAPDLYDIAREATDSVLGEGTYASVNEGNRDPFVQAAIERGRNQ